MDKLSLVVRRFAPPLSAQDVRLLALCSYDDPWVVAEPWRHRARKLAKAGLLEQNPDQKNQYRQTQAGMDVMRRWRELGWMEPLAPMAADMEQNK